MDCAERAAWREWYWTLKAAHARFMRSGRGWRDLDELVAEEKVLERERDEKLGRKGDKDEG